MIIIDIDINSDKIVISAALNENPGTFPAIDAVTSINL